MATYRRATHLAEFALAQVVYAAHPKADCVEVLISESIEDIVFVRLWGMEAQRTFTEEEAKKIFNALFPLIPEGTTLKFNYPNQQQSWSNIMQKK